MLLLALSSVALCAPLVQCEGSVSTAQATVTVLGHGPDPDAARARAVLAGRQVAARLLSGAAWPPVVLGQHEALAAVLDGANQDAVLAVPGARWADGPCSTRQVADAAAWTAVVQGRTATRPEAGVAISAARRLACEEAWTSPLASALAAGATGGDLPRAAAEARQALVACHGAEAVLEAGAGPPDVIAGEGLYECVAAGADPLSDPTGRAWHGSLEAAADAAAWERTVNGALASLGKGLDALASAAAGDRAGLVVAAATRASATPLSDEAQRAATVCRLVPTSGGVQWTHDLWEAQRCAESKEEVPGPWGEGRGQLASARDSLCGERAVRGLEQVDQAVGGAPPEIAASLRPGGWSTVLLCSAGCRADGRAVGPALSLLPARPPTGPGPTADRLRQAVQRRVPESPAVALPGLAASTDPQALWDQLEERAAGIVERALPDGRRFLMVGRTGVPLDGSSP